MATKKQAAERKARWRQALEEGRVVKTYDDGVLTAYLTVEKAQAALAEALRNGFKAEIINLES